ncbi:MAG: trigger factor, partial [Gemmatimonadales bacterium]
TKEDLASKSLQVTVPSDRVIAAEARAVARYAKGARLPGFRPGKAPEALVRRKFQDAIRQTILEEVVQESWERAQSEAKFKPVGQPHIHDLKWNDQNVIEFELHVDVHPEVKLEKTGGFKLERRVSPVTDEKVAEQLRTLQEQKGAWQPIEGEKPKPGQMVEVAVTNLADGDTAEAQPHTLILGEGRAIPELEEKIMTLLPGETVEADVKFPADFPEEAKRGQSRQVRIHLREVKRQELPALDDAFAREVGDFDTLDALKAAVRTDLGKDAEREADARVREQLIERVAGANRLEAPASLVGRLTRGYAEAYGIPEDQLEAFAGEFQGAATGQVKRGLIIDAVVEANGLAATEAEIDARVEQLASARNAPTAQLYASLEKSGRLKELERALTEEKAFAWLLTQSTVTEVSA